MAKIKVKRVIANITIGRNMEPHWIADVDYGAFEVQIPLLPGVYLTMTLRHKRVNMSKRWKVLQQLCFALQIKLENNVGTIGAKLSVGPRKKSSGVAATQFLAAEGGGKGGYLFVPDRIIVSSGAYRNV